MSGNKQQSLAEMRLLYFSRLSIQLYDAVREHNIAQVLAKPADPFRILDLAQRISAEIRNLPDKAMESASLADQAALYKMQDYADCVAFLYAPEKFTTSAKSGQTSVRDFMVG